jgi:hypothetical protein
MNDAEGRRVGILRVVLTVHEAPWLGSWVFISRVSSAILPKSGSPFPNQFIIIIIIIIL